MPDYKHRRPGGRAGKMRLDHHIIWEQANGPIPEGFQIHHLDHNSKNNDLENLVCISVSDHQKYHSPYYMRINGEWFKFCKRCKDINSRSTGSYCHICWATKARIERRSKNEQGISNSGSTLPIRTQGSSQVSEVGTKSLPTDQSSEFRR